jgi:FtsH-binding integral membrane protein
MSNIATTADTVWRDASAVNSAMLRVYNYMLMAIAVSAIAAALVASSVPLMQFLFTGVIKWIVIFAPLVAVFGITMALNSNPPRAVALAMLLGFAALMGVSLATVFVVFTTASIVMAFFSAAILFGTMSVYGYFTRRSLESLGQFLFVGVIAILIASVVNLFVGSSVATTVISALAVVIFLGLTAYDTQRIREMVSVESAQHSVEIAGALSLYIDFINIFVNLLQLFGNRNDS